MREIREKEAMHLIRTGRLSKSVYVEAIRLGFKANHRHFKGGGSDYYAGKKVEREMQGW